LFEARFNLGRLLAVRGRHADAVTEFELCASEQQENATIHFALAASLAETTHFTAALMSAHKALDLVSAADQQQAAA